MPKPKPKQKPSAAPPRLNEPTKQPETQKPETGEDEEENQLAESIKKIKRLMFL